MEYFLRARIRIMCWNKKPKSLHYRFTSQYMVKEQLQADMNQGGYMVLPAITRVLLSVVCLHYYVLCESTVLPRFFPNQAIATCTLVEHA